AEGGVRRDAAEGTEHERRDAADPAREAALRLEVRNWTAVDRVARIPGLRYDLPVARRVRLQRLQTPAVRPAEDLAAHPVRAGRLGQRGHERGEEGVPSGCVYRD